MADFDGLDAIVTGGTGALGRAVVARLVDAGAVVHVPVFALDELDGFPHREDDRCKLYPGLDLGDEADVAKLYASAGDVYASIHVAGGFDMGPIASTDVATWDHLMRLNAKTCFLCCREAVRTMKGRPGRIVNVAARPALVPTPNMTAYASSKAAVAALTLSLAEEVAANAIWVNAVVPSIVDTPTNRAAMSGADYDAWPTPTEIADTIVFLASPKNQVTRGALVPVYGKS